MPLPLYREGELDSKPPIQKDCYLNGSQKGMVRDTVGMTDREKREVTRDYYAHIELIDAQFGRWNFTDAEREVALLLLKGLSTKEVAAVRATSERTVAGRQRSRSAISDS